jgi:hypothetical protein
MRLHVALEGHFGKRKGLVGLALGVYNERFHSQCISMLGVFPQDLIGSFDAYSL